MKRCVGLFCAALVSAGHLPGQFMPGGREIYALSLTGLAPGALPVGLQVVGGGGIVVAVRDGVPMLKAAAVSEFEVSLPEKLPDQFTLQFEIIAKQCCPPDDLFFAGTSSKVQSGNSAEFSWHPSQLTVTGGGMPHTFTSVMPPDLSGILPSALSSVEVSFDGETVKLYTNGKRLFTLTERRFARGRVLRVRLGGTDDADQAVYLAKLRVATGPPVIAQQPPPAPAPAPATPPPSPQWAVLMPPPPPPTATGMVSPAPPPAAPEPVRTPTSTTVSPVPLASGTTAGSVAGATRTYLIAPKPREFVLEGFAYLVTTASMPAPRSVVLEGFAVSAVTTGPPPAPRSIALAGFTALGTMITLEPRTITPGELPGSTASAMAQPKAFRLEGFTTAAALLASRPDPKSFTLSGFTVSSVAVAPVQPKAFKLNGFVTASP